MSDMAHFVGSLNLSRFVARLRVERDPTTRSSLQRLLLEEANNLAFNLGQLGSLQREVVEGRARIAIQIAVVETLAANGQDTRLAESVLSKLIDIQKTIEQYRQVIVDAQTLRTRSPPEPAWRTNVDPVPVSPRGRLTHSVGLRFAHNPPSSGLSEA